MSSGTVRHLSQYPFLAFRACLRQVIQPDLYIVLPQELMPFISAFLPQLHFGIIGDHPSYFGGGGGTLFTVTEEPQVSLTVVAKVNISIFYHDNNSSILSADSISTSKTSIEVSCISFVFIFVFNLYLTGNVLP